MIVVTERLLNSIIHNRQFLKFANKTCHKFMDAGIKDTIKMYDTLGIIDIKKTKAIWNRVNDRLKEIGIA